MLLTSYSRPAVLRVRPGEKLDSDGDPIADWGDGASRVRIPGARVLAPDTDEDEADSTFSTERRLWAPGRIDLRAEDRIEVDGLIYRVDGDPVPLESLATGVYTAAKLVRHEGRR